VWETDKHRNGDAQAYGCRSLLLRPKKAGPRRVKVEIRNPLTTAGRRKYDGTRVRVSEKSFVFLPSQRSWTAFCGYRLTKVIGNEILVDDCTCGRHE
jgi:hypothetical protein